jgi:hypothetical protein
MRFSGTPAPPAPQPAQEPDTMDLKAHAAPSAPTPVID